MKIVTLTSNWTEQWHICHSTNCFMLLECTCFCLFVLMSHFFCVLHVIHTHFTQCCSCHVVHIHSFYYINHGISFSFSVMHLAAPHLLCINITATKRGMCTSPLDLNNFIQLHLLLHFPVSAVHYSLRYVRLHSPCAALYLPFCVLISIFLYFCISCVNRMYSTELYALHIYIWKTYVQLRLLLYFSECAVLYSFSTPVALNLNP